MRHLTRITATILAIVLMATLLTGCSAMLESAEYRSYQAFANQVENGKEFTKDSIIAQLGKPEFYPGKEAGADYMDVTCQEWHYETPDYTGYPWGLDIRFDENGNLLSAEFAAGKGG